MAIPPAATTAPTSRPIPLGTAQSPSHCNAISEYPIRPPASPLSRMAAKAPMRTPTDGSAESDRSVSGAGEVLMPRERNWATLET